MIQIDKTDFLYKSLQKLGVTEDCLDNQYLLYAGMGVSNIKEFNNQLQANLGLDYIGEFDEKWFEDVAEYYKDIRSSKVPAKSKVGSLLKEYKTTGDEKLKVDIINSQLNEVLLIACAYKISHPEVNLSDLVQISNIGLMVAVDKFDPQSKIAFDVYLNYWILDAINKEFTQGEKNG